MVGTLLNTATVVAGTVIGRLLGSRFTPRIQETQMAALGLATTVIGVQSALIAFAPGHPPAQFLAALLAILCGGAIGEVLRLEDALAALGKRAEAHFARTNTSGDFARAFVTTSLLFCVGPLTILGCLDDGLRGDISKLTIKSLLDGIAAAAFAAALGWGVLLSAVTVLVSQGTLTLCAGLLRPFLTSGMIAALTTAGGIMLLGLGLNLLGVTKIRIASFLPALILAPLFLLLLGRWLR